MKHYARVANGTRTGDSDFDCHPFQNPELWFLNCDSDLWLLLRVCYSSPDSSGVFCESLYCPNTDFC